MITDYFNPGPKQPSSFSTPRPSLKRPEKRPVGRPRKRPLEPLEPPIRDPEVRSERDETANNGK